METDVSKRRSVRQAITRKRSRYLDPDTDDDFDIAEGQDSAEEHLQSPEPEQKRHKTTKRRTSKPSPRETRSKAKKPTPKKSPLSRKAKHASKPTKLPAPAAPPVPSDGIIPKWQTLPYEILSQIFSYAFAAELEHETGGVASRRVNHPNTWIMKTARKVCRAFSEPALTAFYRAPNLLAARWLEDFSAIVKQPNDQHLYSYNMKVTSIEVSARNLESFARNTSLSFSETVSKLPRLSSLLITHQLDEPPYEYQGRLPRWRYPLNLFEALDSNKIHLECWRWNANLIEQQDGKAELQGLTEYMAGVHQRPSFQSLRHLTVSHLPAIAAEALTPEEEAADVAFGKIFADLPKLETLSFESCDRLSLQMLLQLPSTLKTIKFINCMPLNSDMLSEFLVSHGHSIQELVLDHNPFLDLAFFTALRTTCPKLKSLRMDLYDHRENHFRHFGEPKYESLLLEDETPTWPSSLQTLELVHLQKWGANAAQNLFRSLVESADSLPDLRRLVLQAHINISWRDRAAFRDQWIERLRRVYQRYPQDPDPNLASLRAFRQWKERLADNAAKERSRTISQVEVVVRKPSLVTQTSQASDDEPLAKRRSRRIIKPASPPPLPTPPTEKRVVRGRRKQGRRDSDAISVVSGDNAGDGEDWRNTPEKFIQGLCNVVDIRIDNQRPREEQFNETHFLDSEASGDEEWTEGAEVEAEDYAW
ncbi:hypothetical protein D6D13_04586 [Aureobasidium pullulans]|uniref:Uncharacterized protein n=1 Tax=Aureobasidium pullulans TaxID=5580 RepID=A0A4S9CW46_AURPU|nr:hypothetical protein D6D13_04586 [Aureobasidium pullulans]